MRRVTVAVKKLAIFVHRWVGVAFCLLFMWWFVSGIFMMYWDYPSVTEADRLERAPVLDPANVKLSPEEAYKGLGMDDPPTAVRLASFDGRPAYHFRMGRGSTIVYADTGQQQDTFPPEMMRRTAAQWAGQPASGAQHELLEEQDQWTIQMRNLLPLNKYVFPDGQHVYISDNTGEVAQYTTTSSRIFAHLGAIPHWLYYTPLRKNGPLWTRVVVWSSAIATAAALLGLIVGIWMFSPRQKYRHEGVPTSIPYKGQKRLHTILGLTFGVLAMTWAFSGMLSMDPFPELLSGGAAGGQAKGKGQGKGKGKAAPTPATRLQQALNGGRFQMARYQSKHPAEALAEIGPAFQAKEIEFTTYAGDPVLLASNAKGETKLVPVEPTPPEQFTADRILNLVRTTAGEHIAEARMLDKYDLYYLDRTGRRPLPVVYVRLNDEANSRFYIDPATARIAARHSDSTRSWVNRWLYHALHSIDLPWLYNYRPAWDIVVLSLMLSCTWLCWTSMVLSYRVLRRKFAPARARRSPSDDLPQAAR